MKKSILKTIIKLMVCTFTAAIAASASAAAVSAEEVRIGIEKYFKDVGSVSIANGSLNVSIGPGQLYYVESNSGFTVRPISAKFYLINEYYSTYDEAADAANTYSNSKISVPVLKDSGWAVYVQNSEAIKDAEVVSTGEQAVSFETNGKILFVVDGSFSARAVSGSGLLDMGAVKYRGSLEFYIRENAIMGINVIDMDEYLYGVVPSEMSASWDMEALKAQAVAARTYAAANKGKHGIYDLCDKVDCQDYNGTNKENDRSNDAVDSTSGQKIYYNNTLISAFYFSSSGGRTSSSENAWADPVPYLRSVDDPYDKEGLVWSRSFTYDELTSICSGKGLDVGTVKAVSVELDEDNIPVRVLFTGTAGTDYVSKDGIRSFFSNSAEGSLPSRNFTLDSGAAIPQDITVLNGDATKNTIKFNSVSIIDGSNTITKSSDTSTAESKDEKVEIKPIKSDIDANHIVFNGKGFGHLVGMSQYGAKGMAEEGYKYDEILKHYYTGVEVK